MFYKQNALLKAPDADTLTLSAAKGVAKFTDDGTKRLEISLANVDLENASLKYSAGDFSVTYKITGKNFSFVLPPSALSGGGVLILDEKTNKPLLYGGFSASAPTADDMLSFSAREDYDDELVADENYYEFDKSELKTGDNRLIAAYNGESEVETDCESEISVCEKSEENERESEAELMPYHKRVESELERIFGENPRERDLENAVTGSKWAKVNYGDGKHYVVGIIYDKKTPKWICYGVPGRYGEKPGEIKNYCSFIPASLFESKGAGYWISYQRADSGETLDFFARQ